MRNLKFLLLTTFTVMIAFTMFLMSQETSHAAAIGDITKFEKTDEKTFTITSGNDKVRAIFYRDDMVRIWLGVNGSFTDAPGKNGGTALEPIVIKNDFGPMNVTWSDEGAYYKMNSGKFVLRAYKSPLKFAMYKSDNATLVWEEQASLNYTGTSTTQKLSRGADEYFYGGGMQNGYFSHRDKTIKIGNNFGGWGDGTVSNPSPFYLSTNGYGVLRNTFREGSYDFGSPLSLTHNENRFDAYYFYGETMRDILNGYTDLTGKPSLIPRWGMGLGDADCYNKAPDTTLDVLKVAKAYRDNDMPGAWILPNDGYGCGYVNLTETVQKLHELGFYTGLWTQQGVDQIATEVGVHGTRLNKLDVAWVGSGHDFALNGSKQAYQGTENNSNDRGYVWSVAGWAGTQRYSAVWSGDQAGDWEFIRFHIPSMIGAGLSGMAYSTGDIDGIFGGSAKTQVRDLQWKVFTPILMNMSGWAAKDKQPWVWGEPYTSYNRDYLKLRQRLTPYFYTYLHESYVSGAPLMRGMVYEFPNDPNTKNTLTQYQFMSGENFLVAPVYTDTTLRNGIYLPKGKWIDYWSGVEHYGSKMLDEYAAPLNKLPLLVKAGAIIPMYPESLYDGQVPPNPITYDIYPYKTSSFKMYEDDGVTREHRQGKYAETLIKSIAPETGTGELVIQVGATVGDYKGKLGARKNQFTIHMHNKPGNVSLSGNTFNELTSKSAWDAAASGWFFDAADKGGILYVKTDELPTNQGFELRTTGFVADTTPLKDAVVIEIPQEDTDPSRIPQEDIIATASNADSSTPASNVLDASRESIWSTNLTGSAALPQSITLNLGTNHFINRVKVLPRQYGGTDGIITEYKLYSSLDGTNYSLVTSGQWNADKEEKTVAFDTVEAQYVRIEVVKGVNGFASIAEANVYRDPTKTAPTPIKKSEMKATAASFQSGSEASKAIDGNSSTVWHTKWDGSDKLPQSITIELGSIHEISQVRYAPRTDAGNGTFTKYNLYLSTDGTNYAKVSSGDWVRNSAKKYIKFAPTLARYVKLEAVEALGGFASASEIDVYDAPKAEIVISNISEGKAISADSSDSAFPASNANDGKPDTRWSAADHLTGHTLTVDFGKMYSIQGSETSFESSTKAYQYKIEVREDNTSNWIQVANRTANTEAGAVLKDNFASRGRYARITITGLPDAAAKASISEFKLFGYSLGGITKVTGVTVDKPTLSMDVLGAAATLTATVAPVDASIKTVTWSSSDPSIAMVDAQGVVTAKGQGTATITVTTTDGNFKATSDVTVKGQENLVKIPQSQMTATATSFEAGENDPKYAIDGDSETHWHTKWYNVDPLPQSLMIELGGTYTISKVDYLPRPEASNGTILAYNVYVSEDGTNYTKVGSGKWLRNNLLKEINFTPVKAKFVKLEATEGVGDFASVAELNVYRSSGSQAELQSIALNASSYTVKVNESTSVQVTAKYADGSSKEVTAQVQWTVAQPTIASLTSGSLKGIAVGDTTITASFGGKTATADVHVNPAAPTSPATSLTGDSTVQADKDFKVRVGLSGVTTDVYAQELALTYDTSALEVVAVNPVKDGLNLLQKSDINGKLHYIIASEGPGKAIKGDAQVLEITFRAKSTEQDRTANINLVNVVLGDATGAEVSATPSSFRIQIITEPQGIPGDFNHDGKVSIGDLALMALNYGKTTASPDWEKIKHMDLKKDGVIDILDLAEVASLILK
ncbi:discoidin domain-containing protein [Paenibacillus terrigena]|uniref:discoidin domain-containing protein n=1 Tax=Paenibacillus terrigena TaxID=369333 RepID=UPI0028CFDBA8|nr:discoidin domain-containing protein [Paenibacillus terrigena]